MRIVQYVVFGLNRFGLEFEHERFNSYEDAENYILTTEDPYFTDRCKEAYIKKVWVKKND